MMAGLPVHRGLSLNIRGKETIPFSGSGRLGARGVELEEFRKVVENGGGLGELHQFHADP